MKDVFKSLKENATSRLKNPVIGAFVLSWCALNINGLSTFVLSANKEKLQIIANKSWGLQDDVFFPLFIASIYLLLLPVLNLVYEFVNDSLINALREQHKNKTDKERFLLQKSTVSAKIEADEEYIRKLKDREIDGWIEEKSVRNRELINQKNKYASLLSSLTEKEHQFVMATAQWSSELKTVREALQTLEMDNESQLSYLDNSLTEVGKILSSLDELDDQYVVDDVKELRKKVDDIRIRLGLWEDIPF